MTPAFRSYATSSDQGGAIAGSPPFESHCAPNGPLKFRNPAGRAGPGATSAPLPPVAPAGTAPAAGLLRYAAINRKLASLIASGSNDGISPRPFRTVVNSRASPNSSQPGIPSRSGPWHDEQLCIYAAYPRCSVVGFAGSRTGPARSVNVRILGASYDRTYSHPAAGSTAIAPQFAPPNAPGI